MIGVVADQAEHIVIHEFFELFKTPWEFYQNNRQYEVLLCSGDHHFDEDTAKLTLIYASKNLASDPRRDGNTTFRSEGTVLTHKGCRLPIYGECITFQPAGTDVLLEQESHESAMRLRRSQHGLIVQIGYSLFHEVDALLRTGQPAKYANIPTLDLHIALLRELIIDNGVRLIEVPPFPDGYRFIACLTHDVDHPSIHPHKWDHTMLGFLHRAVFGSLVNLVRGRISISDLVKNWAAVLKLPFVHLGLAKDFWCNFEDRYLELEEGLCSTFFVIPFQGDSGRLSEGQAPAYRAAHYRAKDIAGAIDKILAAGCEVGLHGIDAWLDSAKGREEIDEIRELTGESEVGVRMHWLYNDKHSAAALEEIDAAYDSTAGYKETVGYYAGTTQVYKLLQAVKLLELPLHVMDTALFYPAYMGLSQRQGTKIVRKLIDDVNRSGGCITINWHDRSLAPERLWGECYRHMIQDLKDRGAWFATAGQAVSWFRKRRSVAFLDGEETDSVRVQITDARDDLPSLRLRIYNARESCKAGVRDADGWLDLTFDESVNIRLVAPDHETELLSSAGHRVNYTRMD